jgi:hypothetical protein
MTGILIAEIVRISLEKHYAADCAQDGRNAAWVAASKATPSLRVLRHMTRQGRILPLQLTTRSKLSGMPNGLLTSRQAPLSEQSLMTQSIVAG